MHYENLYCTYYGSFKIISNLMPLPCHVTYLRRFMFILQPPLPSTHPVIFVGLVACAMSVCMLLLSGDVANPNMIAFSLTLTNTSWACSDWALLVQGSSSPLRWTASSTVVHLFIGILDSEILWMRTQACGVLNLIFWMTEGLRLLWFIWTWLYVWLIYYLFMGRSKPQGVWCIWTPWIHIPYSMQQVHRSPYFWNRVLIHTTCTHL